jgi:ParB-like chromosome segregation protein Spo0J
MPILDEAPFDLVLGQLQRIPCKFIESKVKSNALLVKSLAQTLSKTQRNILPVIVKPLAEDHYEAVFNHLILEAAQEADLDFVLCVPVDAALEAQVIAESGQSFQLNALTATEKELIDALTYIKAAEVSLKTIDPTKVAKVIVAARTPAWKDLKPLTKLKCGVGPKKVPTLGKYLVIGKG